MDLIIAHHPPFDKKGESNAAGDNSPLPHPLVEDNARGHGGIEGIYPLLQGDADPFRNLGQNFLPHAPGLVPHHQGPGPARSASQ